MTKTVADVMKLVKEKECTFVDFRFVDTKGKEQHTTVPISAFDEDKFESGHAFDGSSIAGWKGIEASDMLLMPDPTAAYIDPFYEEPTLVLTCDVIEPSDGKGYDRDPRSIAKRAEAYLKSSGLGDAAYFGPEPEFFIFDGVRWGADMQGSFVKIDSEEAPWSSGAEVEGGNTGHRPGKKGGYFPVSPTDQFADLRDEIVMKLEEVGLEVERSHHEVGTAGQMEINYRFSDVETAGDDIMKFKYVVKNTAWQNGKTATFMPKPLYGDNGSGMHVHQSLWKDGKPLFFEAGNYGDLSDMARWYIGGLLKHAPSLLAFTNPTVNSYRRLVPGYEAPVNLAYSARNRSACIRIPITGSNPKAKRIEFRCPDPSSNPYLAFAAMLMAGLDGIENKIEPAAPVDKDIYELEGAEAAAIPQVPGSLDAALNALEKDHAFLTKGGVFTDDLIETWIAFKRKEEVDYVRLRPHPAEFELYYDI